MTARDSSGASDAEFDFAGEAWLDHLVEALEVPELGSIGPYEILEEVARGGQGVVYRARQVETRREIALKRLVEGRHASEAARRRFEREIEAAATLDHPGIVTLFGVDRVDGVPVVAMQWIDGVPIDDWARAVPSGPRRREERLRLFLRVCDAVEHAHRRGILHLDLKPSNVLVDRDANPHVVDFGLARMIDRDLDLTRTGTFLGTLAYASPEQLEGGRRRLDARSDVYSLGVILYELLLGERPFAFEDGVTPALAAKGRGAPRAAEGRRLGLGGELDAIVLKALAPRREERYGNVSALADDLRRLLDGRPVLAHPPGIAYDLAKLARRHPGATALGLLSLLLVIAGAIQSWRHAAELRAERNAQAAARRDAERAEERATAAAETADGILRFLLSDVFELALPQNLGADLTLGGLLDVAAERSAERFAARPSVEARVRLTLGEVYRRLGRYDAAERELLRADALFPADPEHEPLRGRVAKQLGHVYAQSGREPEAIVRFEEALERIGDAPAPRADLEQGIGMCRLARGDVVGATVAFERSLEVVVAHGLDDARRVLATSGLGIARAKAGDFPGARDRYEEALADARRAFGPDDERVAEVLAMLADLDEAEGKKDDAIRRSRASLRIMELVYGDGHPLVAAALGDLGGLLDAPGELDEGAALIERAIAINVAVRGDDSVFTAFHRCRLGKNLVLRRRYDDAIPVLAGAIARVEASRGRLDPWARVGRETLARAYYHSGRQDEAEREVRALIEIRDALGMPDWARSRLDEFLAQIELACGRPDEAAERLERTLTALARSERIPRAALAARVEAWQAGFRLFGADDGADRLEALAARLGVVE